VPKNILGNPQTYYKEELIIVKKDPYQRREAEKYDQPIASREHILATLEQLGVPASLKRLAKTLSHEEAGQSTALETRLRAMVRDGQLVVDRRNVYAIAKKLEMLVGKVSAHPDGFGFLLMPGDDEDIFLTERQMKSVFHGDKVQVKIRGKDRRGRSEGEIVEVLERNTQQLVGKIYFEGKFSYLEPLNNRINHEVMIISPQGSDEVASAQHKANQIVVVEVIDQPTHHGHVTAKVLEVLGDHLTPAMEVEIALRNHDIPTEWPEELMAQIDAMPSEVSDKAGAGRHDLRQIPFVTIDGEDARDFDDAVYCEPKRGGGWRLYVAIADVAHYVEIGTDLDRAAYDRSTSVYFPQYVVPMLPEKLSNGLCSLKPEVDRLAMVCEMTISAQGRLGKYVFYEAVIKSAARLTYTQVGELLENKGEFPKADLIPCIEELHELYKALVLRREDRGALEFESTEPLFHFDAEGRVERIEVRARNVAHKIIEEAMLCANVAAARFIARPLTAGDSKSEGAKKHAPGLFRVHEPPEPEKVEFLAEFFARFGVTFNAGNPVETKDFKQITDQLKHRENGQVLQIALLRSLKQAVYSPENKGHFGLAYKEYTHFTSPIRRYPDLLTHRLIKSIIHSKQESKFVKRFGEAKEKRFYPYTIEEVIAFGEHTSFAERRAEAAVYDVLDWMKCDFLSDKVGDIQAGVITGVTKFGFFVELANVYIEGLVHVSTLSGDYYRFDDSEQSLVGERTHTVFGMGDKVQVQIAGVNVEERKIDFQLVEHSPLKGRRSVGKKKTPRRESTKSGKKTSSAKRKPDPRKKSSVKSDATNSAKPKRKQKPKQKSGVKAESKGPSKGGKKRRSQ
jgi:ribonuclease R